MWTCIRDTKNFCRRSQQVRELHHFPETLMLDFEGVPTREFSSRIREAHKSLKDKPSLLQNLETKLGIGFLLSGTSHPTFLTSCP
jgi:hypothetical protein